MRRITIVLALAALPLFAFDAAALTNQQVHNVCGNSYHTTPGGAQGCSKQGSNKKMTYYYCDKDGKNCGAIVVREGGSTSKLPPGVSELGSPARVNR
jgi:hypothetical protein